MDFSKLDKSISGVVKEQQIKLGYRREKVRLYYPLSSLNRLLGKTCSVEQMQECLQEYAASVADQYGTVTISHEKDRFCIIIPEQGSEYIHADMKEDEFLVEFIDTIRRHGCTLNEVLAVFRKYSGHVHVEKMKNSEFDYLVYFEDGEPEDFLYCLGLEGEHIIYHRFTPEDYEEFLQ
ncbi:MAG: DUF3877 family protein [Lachnospiraceae bacterium]|nr:DUF3877 family protein [Lachnospiraceae bacterium]